MTDTISRGAANQAGAIINPNAAAEAQDFLPLQGHRPRRVLGRATRSRPRTTTARCGASPRSPTRGSRPASGIGPAS